jgi:malonyl-CoA O-methyltransferase
VVDKALLARRFARAAPAYELHARVQEQAADALVEAARRRAGQRVPRRLLDVGCGTGLLTARLLDAWPGAAALALDLAEGMVAVAARRLAGRAVRFTVRDIVVGFPDERFDLAASSMALQWVHDPGAVLRGAAGRLAGGGLLALAVPVAGTLPELRAAYAGAAAELGLAAWRHPGLAFHEAARWEAWTRAAFRDVEVREEVVVEHHPGARAVLEAIRGVGGNDCEGGAGAGAVRLLRRALARYDAHHRDQEGVPATWRLALVTARGPRRRQA